MVIPAHQQHIGQEEENAVLAVLKAGQVSGNGPVCRRVERYLSQMLAGADVALTSSCTAALEMALMTLNIGPGDEVIVPSFTFSSTANCVVVRGATPVYADVRPSTLNIDPWDVERRITPRTRAIICMHYAGIGCDMDRLRTIANEHDLYLIENAALAFGARYKGELLGTIGDIGCLSFHSTRVVSCGEGGAFVTRNPEFAKRARLIRAKGTNIADFEQGKIDRHSWVSIGSNYALSDLNAAILEVQLGRFQNILTRRRWLWDEYRDALSLLASSRRIILPDIAPGRDSNYATFFFNTQDETMRNLILTRLNNRGIEASPHYQPLHQSEFGRAYATSPLPITEACSRSLIRLPLYPDLSPRQVRLIVKEIEKLFAPTQRDWDTLQSSAKLEATINQKPVKTMPPNPIPPLTNRSQRVQNT